jgi:hypothetical protein
VADALGGFELLVREGDTWIPLETWLEAQAIATDAGILLRG